MMRRSTYAAPFCLAALLAACSDSVVRETLEIAPHGDGSSEVAFAVTVPMPPHDASDALRDHLAGRRREYLEGWDAWARRFERAGAERETLAWEKVDGELGVLRRTARFDEPQGLSGFFLDTDLTVLFHPGSQRSELGIIPGPPSRASRDQVERFERLLDDWSRSVARYLQRVAELYAYLEARPGRARPVFRALFEDAPEGLREREEERLEGLADAVFEVLDVAGRTTEEPESLETLARRVYDPFPAELTVRISGEVSTVLGFVELGDGLYLAPPLGLEHALVGLEQRWIEPPLLTAYERHERLGERSDLDLSELAARPRAVRPLPTPAEISAAVAEALDAEPEYRLVWRPADDEE